MPDKPLSIKEAQIKAAQEAASKGGIGSEAQQASQINGGGCLPPPTPPIKDGADPTLCAMMGFKSNINEAERVKKYEDKSLAWQTSTRRMMATGLQRDWDPDVLAKIPEDLGKMGKVMVDGRVVILHRPRRVGMMSQWETSSMAQNYSVYGERAYQ